MRLVGKPHIEGDVADAAIGVAGIAQCKQGSAQPAPADVGFNAARHLELPEQLAAGNAELAREPGGGEVAMMQIVFDVAAQAATKITGAAARLAAPVVPAAVAPTAPVLTGPATVDLGVLGFGLTWLPSDRLTAETRLEYRRSRVTDDSGTTAD